MNYLKRKRENVFFSPIKHFIKVFFFFWRINLFFIKLIKSVVKLLWIKLRYNILGALS